MVVRSFITIETTLGKHYARLKPNLNLISRCSYHCCNLSQKTPVSQRQCALFGEKGKYRCGLQGNILFPVITLKSSNEYLGRASYSETRKTGEQRRSLRTSVYYLTAIGVLVAGASYAAVPLYRLFCQATSFGGTISAGHDASKVEAMKKIEDRMITIKFNADTASSMAWKFRPQQNQIKVIPGETALAFYTATNPTSSPITGISTYNVIPFEAGQYFNKIQCFCFEEQILNPKEQVDMPVFFYIDPDFVKDPKMKNVDTIILSYTFFEAREGLQLPVPQFATTLSH